MRAGLGAARTCPLRHDRGSDGYAMVALLVGLSIMAVALSVALPTWRTMAQREREAELIFRGQQYARAIALYQRQYANAFPPNLDLLVDQRFLRRKYKDPMTGDEFQLLYVGQPAPGEGPGPPADGRGGPQAGAAGRGQGDGAAGRGTGFATQPAGLSATPLGGRGGIMGVSSKSDRTSLREWNGRRKYNEWTFVATQASTRAGGPAGGQTPTGGRGGEAGRGGLGGPGGRQNAPPGRGTAPRGGGGLEPSGGGGGQPFGGRGLGGRF